MILEHGHRKITSDSDRDESFDNGSDDGTGAMILQRRDDPRWRQGVWMVIRGKLQPVEMIKEAQVRLGVLMLVLFGLVLGDTFGGKFFV